MAIWNKLADRKTVEKTMVALSQNGIEVFFVEDGAAAKKKAFELIPEGSEIMTMSSTTTDSIGLTKDINESGKYVSVKSKLYSMDRNTQGLEMKKLGAAPSYALGSVHAVTQDGHALIASALGSQLPAYAYASPKVIWVVGTQKIVKDTKAGMKRIYDYVLPLEDARARKVYGAGSGVNKLLIFNKESPGRVTMILVNEVLGF